MTIIQAITELLQRDKRVVIPRLGILKSDTEPAKINVVTNHFTPPSSKILFSPENNQQDDTLALYLAEKNNISNDEALNEINEFADSCNRDLKNLSKANFGELGKLVWKYDGSYEFEMNESLNFNDDAFGLPDFRQSPIFRSETKIETTANTDIDNNTDNGEDNNVSTTTTTVVEKTETSQNDTDDNNTIENGNDNDENQQQPEPEEKKKHRVWPWILLLLLLLLCAGFVALTYFELIPNYIPQIIKPKNKVQVVIGGESRPYYHYEYTEPEDTTAFPLPYPDAMIKYNDSIQHIADSIAEYAMTIDSTETPNQIETEPVQPEIEPEKPVIEPEKPVIEPEKTEVEPAQTGPKYLIVCGCFSVEENAQKKVNQLLESGYPNAFYKKRGSMWNAYYDTYSDKQEAKQALDEIRATVNAKAWLLETKK